MVEIKQTLYIHPWIVATGHRMVVVPSLEEGKQTFRVLALNPEGLVGVDLGETHRTLRKARQRMLELGAVQLKDHRILVARVAHEDTRIRWHWADAQVRQWVAAMRLKETTATMTTEDEHERIWRLYLIREGF